MQKWEHKVDWLPGCSYYANSLAGGNVFNGFDHLKRNIEEAEKDGWELVGFQIFADGTILAFKRGKEEMKPTHGSTEYKGMIDSLS